jgi:transposase
MKKKKAKIPTEAMPIVRPNVAGIDLGSVEHYVCAPVSHDGGTEVRRFGTTTTELRKLAAWLKQCGVESAAMESTGIYWIPLYEILEAEGIEPVLVNARQLHKVPGRKTDVKDCQWIQKLHACGLLRGSFRPTAEICQMRSLTRQCTNLVEERSKAVAWMQKALDQMNVQVHRAVTDMTGVTGMSIVRAIIAGERDPIKLAQLRDKRCGKTVQQFAEHLNGNWKAEHLFNLERALEFFDHLESAIAKYQERISELLKELTPEPRQDAIAPAHPKANKAKAIRQAGDEPLRKALWRLSGVDLTTIDGIGVGASQIILTELGTKIDAFPTEHDFVSWLRLCPRTSISGGKPLPKKPNGRGSNRISSVLRMASVAVEKSKTALGAEFRRIARRKNGKTAVFAIARKLAILIYRLLRYGQVYIDIGQKSYEEQFNLKRLKSLQLQAKELGFILQAA